MSKKLTKQSFSTFADPDENLLMGARAGNISATNELLQKYFDMRFAVARYLSPTIVRLLDRWEFNHAFFDAYNNTCKNYSLATGHSVRSYFSTLFKNSLIQEASHNDIFQRLNTLSLDEEHQAQTGDSYTLADIVPDNDPQSNVVYYMNYMDALEKFSERDFKLDDIDKAVVKLRVDGLTYEEIGQTLSISISHARTSYLKFYDKVLETIKVEDLTAIKKELDQFK